MSKRIALCFSGQPRTWEKCYTQWMHFSNAISALHDAKVDIFCHAWDFNTPPNAVSWQIFNKIGKQINFDGIKISEEEKEKFIKLMNPVSYVFEDESVSLGRSKSVTELNEQYIDYYGRPVASWIASQFYGIMYSAYLKKKYELANKFKYDMVVRMRYDLYMSDPYVNNMIFSLPEYNIAKAVHTGKTEDFPFHRMGDIFWYSDSITYDRISEFYRWLPLLGSKSFPKSDKNPNPLIESVLYFYIKMLKINVYNIDNMDPKIYRMENTLDIKKQYDINLDNEPYELI